MPQTSFENMVSGMLLYLPILVARKHKEVLEIWEDSKTYIPKILCFSKMMFRCCCDFCLS